MTEHEPETEVIDISTRDGAIQALREMRQETNRLMLSESEVPPEDMLLEAFGQLYGMSIILGGILGDPHLAAELQADGERFERVAAEEIAKIKGEAP